MLSLFRHTQSREAFPVGVFLMESNGSLVYFTRCQATVPCRAFPNTKPNAMTGLLERGKRGTERTLSVFNLPQLKPLSLTGVSGASSLR